MITVPLVASIALPAIVALDHILAANPNWQSNSTGQLIKNVLGAGFSFLIDRLRALAEGK